ncbi:YhcN/YlaJ family sporulation lipoprotein [Virgibacillus sp. L01]|uniref:YhcN/YlaJ family sporulation lipoprotein n=1 Tax=Virgibacillus sp. L01 TaxID=3457429 RepID=UPI003FD5D28C
MKWKLLCLLAVISIALVACQGDNGNGNEQGQNGDGNNVEQTRYNATDNMNNGGNNGNNNGNGQQGNGENQYELAEKAADKISNQVKGIDNAYVLKTDNNAYVAAELDNGNNGNTDNGNTGGMNNGNGNNTGNMNDNTNGNNGNGGNMNVENNGLTNNGNDNDGGDQLTDEVKQEVSKIVKSVDKDVDNVYVSTNPDFFDLANNYADDAGNGDPVEGLFDQMGNMIERIFPQNQN